MYNKTSDTVYTYISQIIEVIIVIIIRANTSSFHQTVPTLLQLPVQNVSFLKSDMFSVNVYILSDNVSSLL